ncbi:MAG: monovalent cation/H(+) antiporter subunit G [bacterium]
MIFFQVLSLLLVAAGAFFLLIGSIGIIRLPDFFSRTHATAKSDTLGLMLALSGLAVHEGFTINSAKLLTAILFVALTNPVGAHALARAAYQSGLKPWFRGGPQPEDPVTEAGPDEVLPLAEGSEGEEE